MVHGAVEGLVGAGQGRGHGGGVVEGGEAFAGEGGAGGQHGVGDGLALGIGGRGWEGVGVVDEGAGVAEVAF